MDKAKIRDDNENAEFDKVGKDREKRLYIGLIHDPVYDKNRKKIVSAITNLDLHDLSRVSKTYGARRFFIVTPLEDQINLAERIVKHWTTGAGASYNRDRKTAMELIELAPSIDEAVERIKKREGDTPLLMATDAGDRGEKTIDYTAASEILHSGQPVFLLFGTAWGLEQEVFKRVDYILAPIKGIEEYNHLSVRAAAAIITDRLMGRIYR